MLTLKSLSQRVFLAAMLGCSVSYVYADNFISDANMRKQVEWDYKNKQKTFPKGDLFNVFNQKMTEEEREAMKFLYAYMPMTDISDYKGDFHLKNVRLALQARKEMPWGKVVPEREFRHFVVPERVNNENLDNCREVFYNELRDRVKNLDMYNAVLEVNHWCHEKVVYKPSDGRTSSPLATVKTAYGRCGEESTFLVAALRSVGIPARQVYTPRWAHTDDNHAWVEAWVNGKWYFLGACEPEPVLNLGWFNAPASRAMLVHTKVFGRYDGPEEVMSRNACTTEINVIENYAPTAKVEVEVVDVNGKSMKDLDVEFKVYNYGEFYTVANKKTDSNGVAWLSAGKGDMLVYSGNGTKYGIAKVSFGKDKRVKLALTNNIGDDLNLDYTMVPPVENVVMPEVTDAQRAENTRRMIQEDSIRGLYVNTFLDKQIEGIDARGNWQTIKDFVNGSGNKEKAISFLYTLSAKDWRDVSEDVLADHFFNTKPQPCYNNMDSTFVMDYIYCPRVANEMITPYKNMFERFVSNADKKYMRAKVENVVEWCRKNIKIDNTYNPLRYAIQPEGVIRSLRSDDRSIGIFFVSLARSMGWAARIDGVTGKVQYNKEGKWYDIDLGAKSDAKQAKQGTLKLTYTSNGIVDNPAYYYHFTISKFDNGTLNLLEYDEGDSAGEGANWTNTFKNGTELDNGYYLMSSGSRLANGSVLANVKMFNIGDGETTTKELVMRKDNESVAVLGSFDSENLFNYLGTVKDLNSKQAMTDAKEVEKSLLSTTGRGYYVLGVIASEQEPTNHALEDISAEKELFKQWGRPMVLVFADEVQRNRFRPEEFKGLPNTVSFGVDKDKKIQNDIISGMKLKNNNLPIFIIADTFNRVVFISQGYTIGLGAQLKKVIKGISQ